MTRRRSLRPGFLSSLIYAQKAEYEFYPEFRKHIGPKLRADHPGITEPELLRRYADVLESEGVSAAEIARRTALIREKRADLEADYWNRFYLSAHSSFNREPNAFLVEVVKHLKPGTALDYAMGEGRNALYLAKRGWRVWGFDPADAAVELAQRRAKEAGLTIHTAAVRDSEYDFGKGRFDLVVFSWSMPLVPVRKVVDALKPNGMVVMECGVEFTGRNGMLHLFDALRIVRYEIIRMTADFSDRRESDVIRMIAVNE